MINEQELAEAVERLREGETVLGVGCDDVYMQMATDIGLLQYVFEHFHNTAKDASFESMFSQDAESLLSESYRTKLEHEAGL